MVVDTGVRWRGCRCAFAEEVRRREVKVKNEKSKNLLLMSNQQAEWQVT